MPIELWGIDSSAGQAVVREGEHWFFLSVDNRWAPVELTGENEAIRWSRVSTAVQDRRTYSSLTAATRAVRQRCLKSLPVPAIAFSDVQHLCPPALLRRLEIEESVPRSGRADLGTAPHVLFVSIAAQVHHTLTKWDTQGAPLLQYDEYRWYVGQRYWRYFPFLPFLEWHFFNGQTFDDVVRALASGQPIPLNYVQFWAFGSASYAINRIGDKKTAMLFFSRILHGPATALAVRDMKRFLDAHDPEVVEADKWHVKIWSTLTERERRAVLCFVFGIEMEAVASDLRVSQETAKRYLALGLKKFEDGIRQALRPLV